MTPVKRSFDPQRACVPQVEKHSLRASGLGSFGHWYLHEHFNYLWVMDKQA